MVDDTAEGHNARAGESFRAGDYDEAYRRYSRAIKRDKGVAKYFTNRAACCVNLDR